MQDELIIIRRIIYEHHAIRGHMKLAGDSVADKDALAALQEARTDFIPGRLEAMVEKQNKLQQTMSYLDEGLRNHFAFEEKVLPPFFGELLMRTLVLEHREIRKEIDKARTIITKTKLEGVSREELLSKYVDVQQLVDNIRKLVEEHASKEEVILAMIERALEDKEQNNG